jgi:hypothetical protein
MPLASLDTSILGTVSEGKGEGGGGGVSVGLRVGWCVCVYVVGWCVCVCVCCWVVCVCVCVCYRGWV